MASLETTDWGVGDLHRVLQGATWWLTISKAGGENDYGRIDDDVWVLVDRSFGGA